MLFHHHNLTIALHTKLNGSLADQWLKAAAEVTIDCLADELRLLEWSEVTMRFVELDRTTQQHLIQCFSAQETAQLLAAMPPITRRRILRWLPLQQLARVFGQLSQASQNTVLAQLNASKTRRFWQLRQGYQQTFEFDASVTQLSISTSIKDATARYYSAQHVNHYIYVVDYNGGVCGVIHGHSLAVASVRDAPIGLYMEQLPTLITPNHDEGYVKSALERSGLLELPVINHRFQLIGVINKDDFG